jgi:hypothetical protein
MAHHANLILIKNQTTLLLPIGSQGGVKVADTYYLPLESLMGFGVKWKTLLGRNHNHPKFFLSDK